MTFYVEFADEQGTRAQAELRGFNPEMVVEVGGTSGDYRPVLPFRAAQHGATVPDGPLMAAVALEGNAIVLYQVLIKDGGVNLKGVGAGTTALYAEDDPNSNDPFRQTPTTRADVLGVNGGAMVLTGQQAGGFFYQEQVAPDTTQNRLTFFRAGEVEIADPSLKLGRSNQRASFAGQ